MSLLQVSGIGLQESGHEVLKNISFTQQALEKVAIAGETGSGKSTLLQTIAGLAQPSAGRVIFQNKRVKGPQEQLVPGHPEIAYLSQQFELPPFLRVEQVLQYANKLPAAAAKTLYEVCRINHLLTRSTSKLSGGERQRIALARLLLSSPQLLLLDEPFSNLDMGHKSILKSVIRDIGEELKISLILVSHDPLDTLSWANQILVMQAGQVVQQGPPEQIYKRPVNAYAASLFGNYNLIPAAQTKAFAEILGLKENGKELLIRPENLEITTKSGALAGKVTQVTFFGAYYEIEVSIGDILIKVKTETGNYVISEPITVAVSPEDVWPI